MSEATQSFSSEQEWINKGASWLTRHPRHSQFFRAICFDSLGRIVTCGGDFMQATKDDAYPVYWVWPDQNIFNMVDSVVRKEQKS